MITYRAASKNDLNTIAKVHTDCFKEYFLTSLGNHLLAKYYGEYINEGGPFILAVSDVDGIIGFCMGYQTGSRARANFEKNNKFQLLFKLLYLCLLCNKSAWDRVLSKIKSSFGAFIHKKNNSVSKNKKSPEGTILSVCVVEKYRGTDVSKTLISKFEDELRTRKIEKCTLSVHTTNSRARAFYEKVGFNIQKESADCVVYVKTID